ncbi:hypothetical protein [Bosea sp. UNC402CLCol]|uniref:hypothetical protein n=1 Tax=Bosea sp. UNC402CLCol TaxID=1510531 RepID=UPI0012E09910|nr:hypothetical protein [Bosea sp. UNC402CLCol]
MWAGLPTGSIEQFGIALAQRIEAAIASAPATATAEPHERIRKLMQALDESAASEGRWQHRAQHFERLYEECQAAMENAGYLGSVPNCIKELCARAEKVEAAPPPPPQFLATEDGESNGNEERFPIFDKQRLARRMYEHECYDNGVRPEWDKELKPVRARYEGYAATAIADLCPDEVLENQPVALADARSKDPSRPAMPKEEDTSTTKEKHDGQP